MSTRAAPSVRQILHNRQIYRAVHMLFRARPAKNGASLSIWRSRRRARQAHSVNVRLGRRECCNRAQPARSTAKWRFWPSKKRHKAPFSATFSSIFPVFFQRAYSEWRFGRECDLEMRVSRIGRGRRRPCHHTVVNRIAQATTRKSVVPTRRGSASLGRDHERESVVQTGRRSSNLGREPDLSRSAPPAYPARGCHADRFDRPDRTKPRNRHIGPKGGPGTRPGR